MSTFPRAARHHLLAAALLCGAAASLAQTRPEPAAAAAAARPAASAPAQSALTAPLLYDILVGEVLFGEGEPIAAVAQTLHAARRSQDERLYRRAAEMATAARSGPLALEAAKAWRQAMPQSLDARRYELVTLVRLGRVQASLTPLVHYISALPANERASAITALPSLYRRTPDQAEAQRIFTQAMRQVARAHPEQAPLATAAIGHLYRLQDEYEQALQWAERVQQAAPQSEQAALLALQVLADADKLADTLQQQALRLVEQHLAQARPSATVRLAYARQLVNMDAPDQALAQLSQAIAQQPQEPMGWLLRGALLADQKQNDAAEKDLLEYLRLVKALSPEQAEQAAQERDQAHVLLAKLAEARGDHAASEKWLDAIESPSRQFFRQLDRARLQAQQKRYDQALDILHAAQASTPDEERRKLLLEVGILRQAQRHQQAYELLAAELAAEPPGSPLSAGLMYETALAAERTGRVDEMERLLREVIRLNPDDADAYNALGYSLADRNQRLDEARQLIEKALSLQPDSGHILDSLGWVQFRQGQTAQARQTLSQAFERLPDAEVAAHLGEVLWTLGERDAARAMWRRALDIDADNETLRQTLQRLGVQP